MGSSGHQRPVVIRARNVSDGANYGPFKSVVLGWSLTFAARPLLRSHPVGTGVTPVVRPCRRGGDRHGGKGLH